MSAYDPLRTLAGFAKRSEVDRAGAAMSGFIQAAGTLAATATAFALSHLKVAPDLKTLLIGLFLMSVNAIFLVARITIEPISRPIVLANALSIATMIVFLGANYLLQLDFRLLHFVGLWTALFFAGHILIARYVG